MKNFLLLISLSVALVLQAQTTSKWTDLFSYNNILKICEDSDRLVVATENGIFYYTPSTGEIRKFSKANGLHEVKISAFDYNARTQTGIVGYVNGSMDIISPNGIFLIVDIPIATGFNGDKRINNISISGDKAIISANYGVSVFNISKREFGDTAFFVSASNYEKVNSAVLKDNRVYVATPSGIKYHDINTTFGVYSSWTTLQSGNFLKVDYQDYLMTANNNNVYYGTPTALSSLTKTFGALQDAKIVNGNIIVADNVQSYVFSSTGVQQKTVNAGESINTAYLYNGQLYTGTKFSGMYNEQKSSLKPDGPYNNISYKISLLNGQLWVSTGGRSEYNEARPNFLGYYHYNGTNWIYPEMFKTNNQFNILDVTPNPSNPSEVFFSNYFNSTQKGIFKMVNDEFAKQYALDPSNYWGDLPIGCTFDDRNNLFCTASFIDKTIGTGFYYYNRSSDNFISKNLNVSNETQKPFTKDGVLYIPIPRLPSFVMYNYNNTPDNFSDDALKVLGTSNNLPEGGVFSATIDKNDDLWTGSEFGLRTLSNPKAAISEESPQMNNIVIEENGLAEELFRDAAIIKIVADTGNQKWISVDGGGVFYISSSGDKTIYHFTKSNSPLPDDTVTDIQIDNSNGKVYFATQSGIMVYQGDVADVTTNFGDVLVYPNPVVYAQYKGNVRIRGLAQKTNIRITDSAGNLVYSSTANGGYFEWNLNNQRGVRVASGIYYVLMTNEDGTDTATAKIAVVN